MALNRIFLKILTMGLLLVGITVLPLSACGQGNRESYAYAKTFFDAHRAQLEELVKLVSDCKYADEISSDPRANDPDIDTCVGHKPAYRATIARKLAKLGISSVEIDWWTHPHNGPSRHRFDGASFVLSSWGTAAGSGGGSAIWYFVMPVTKSGLAVPVIPLTPPPYHWVFNESN